MNLSKIKEFYQKNKKIIFYCLLFIISFFYMGDNTFANGEINEEKDSNIAKTIVEGANYLILVASTIVALLSSFISLFLEPGAINGTIFGLEVYLKDIWILISNIVYFTFAFILIAIAFMNIIGKGEQKWELKSALPKFVIGVIIVPFTWFFVQFVLSVSAFLTVSVLSLPYDTLNGTEAFKNVSGKNICTSYTINLFDTKKDQKDLAEQSKNCKKASIQEILKGETGGNTDDLSGTVYGILNIYTYGIMKVDNLSKFQKGTANEIKKLSELGVKLIFDLLFLIIFLIIMVALFLALFARIIWLWIHAMFSPLYGLFYFLGKEGGGDGVMKKLSVTEFISLAMVPVYVSAALSFGLIFIFVAAHGLSQAPEEGAKGIFSTTEDGKDPAINVGGFSLIIKGIKGNKTETKEGGNSEETPGDIFEKLFQGSGNAIGQLFLEIFGLAILWLAVMAALNQSTITQEVTKPIQSFGNSVGELLAKSPQYAPIIPTPGGGLSASGLNQIGSSALQSSTAIGRKSGDDFMKRNKLFGHGINKASTTASLGDALKTHKDNINHPDTFKKLKDALSAQGSTASIMNDKNLVSHIETIAKSMDRLGKDESISDRSQLSKILGHMEYDLEKTSKYNTHGIELFKDINGTTGTLTAKEIDNKGFSKKEGNKTSGNADQATKDVNKQIDLKNLSKVENTNITINSDKEITKLGGVEMKNLKVSDETNIKKIAEKIHDNKELKDISLEKLEEGKVEKEVAKKIIEEIENLKKASN